MLGSKNRDNDNPATGHAPTPRPLVRVVDDEPSIRHLFAKLAGFGDFDCAPSLLAQNLLDTLDENRPGCIVVDLVLPDRTGLELLQELSARSCKLPVVFMSGMARVAEAVRALKLGSIDFLEKPFELQTMLDAVRRAIEIDRQNRQAGNDRQDVAQRFESLTPRESEVMEQIVRGAANKEVASKLGLSPKTVEVHRANVMRKTQARSLAELVRMHVHVHS